MLTAKTRLRLLPPLILTADDVDDALAIFAQRTGEMRMKHLLKLGGMTPEEILHILDVADEYKRLHKDGVDPKDLQGKAVALGFRQKLHPHPPTAARRSPPMCWKPTPTKFSTRRRTASTWKRPCWRCCWRENKSIAVRGAAGERERANPCFFVRNDPKTGGSGEAAAG